MQFRASSNSPGGGGVAWYSDRPSRYMHPAFRAIVAELTEIDGEVRLGDERFEFWVRQCVAKHPLRANPDLYAQLRAFAVWLAQRQNVSSLQLFALASSELNAAETRDAARGSPWLLGEQAQAWCTLAKDIVACYTRERRQRRERRARALAGHSPERRSGGDRRNKAA